MRLPVAPCRGHLPSWEALPLQLLPLHLGLESTLFPEGGEPLEGLVHIVSTRLCILQTFHGPLDTIGHTVATVIVPGHIRGVLPGYGLILGHERQGQVVVKAKPAPPAGGKKIVGEGVAPKQATMRKGGRKPKFIWQFAYIDYSLPNTPVSSAEVPAVCGNIPDEPGTYTITCRAKDPVFGREFEETATVIVYDPAIGGRFGGKEGQRQQTVEGRLPQPPVLGYPPVGGHEGGIEGPNVPGRTPHEQIINEIIKSTPSVPQGEFTSPVQQWWHLTP